MSVRKVYCGKTAEWIRMLFGMASGVGQVMGVLDRSVRTAHTLATLIESNAMH